MNTMDIIIGLIILALVAYGGYKMWLQLSGKKTCCGGTKEVIKPKKLNKVIGKKTVHIEGMHCDNCKNSVTKALNALDGVSGKVDLSKKLAVVSFEVEISNEEITKAIEAQGFEVSEIE